MCVECAAGQSCWAGAESRLLKPARPGSMIRKPSEELARYARPNRVAVMCRQLADTNHCAEEGIACMGRRRWLAVAGMWLEWEGKPLHNAPLET